jgi:hypothetical protein
MLQSVSFYGIPNALYSSPGGSTRVAVSVQPTEVLYSNFSHVYGVGASEGGVPLSQLSILNALLSSLDSPGAVRESAKGAALSGDPERIDAAIRQVHDAFSKAASSPLPYARLQAPVPGSLVALSA